MEVLNELKEMSLSVFLISLFLLCKSCTWTQSLNIYYYIVELCKESVYIYNIIFKPHFSGINVAGEI